MITAMMMILSLTKISGIQSISGKKNDKMFFQIKKKCHFIMMDNQQINKQHAFND